jgi:hypothetical protein
VRLLRRLRRLLRLLLRLPRLPRVLRCGSAALRLLRAAAGAAACSVAARLHCSGGVGRPSARGARRAALCYDAERALAGRIRRLLTA